MKHTYPMTKPEWLRERNNDPCGTPNNHPFWNTVEVTNIGGDCKVFQKNGWFVFDALHNAWYRMDDRLDALIHATKLSNGTSRTGRNPWD